MSQRICPMLSALSPVDEAGRPVDRECIYEQCRFFNTAARDCNLMPGSHAVTEMRREFLQASLELQGAVREAAQAAVDRAGLQETVASGIEETARRLLARLDDLARAIGENGALAEQSSRRVGELAELQGQAATRILEEISLVAAGHHKLDQAVRALEQKLDRAAQEDLNLVQLVTLIKGETERTWAALRTISEGNRTVMQAIEAQLQRDQADLKRRRQEEAETCNSRGVAAYYRGALEGALEAFKRAVELRPDYGEAHNNLGLVLSKLGKEREAIEAFQQALKVDPKMGEVYNNLGFLHHTSSQFERAAEMFGRAIQNAADSSVAYTNLGNCFYQMKQPEKALEAWRRAVELDPMNDNARRGLRMFQQDPAEN